MNKRINTHLIRHIWEDYARKILLENPDYYGVSHNKIRNYYIYRKGTKKYVVRVNYPSGAESATVHSQQGLVNSYEIFRKIIEEYLAKARQAIINGEAVHFAHIGKICAKRVERDFRKKTQRMIDWAKTKKQTKVWNDEAGKEIYPKYFYFADDDWCRIGWIKANIKNDTVYEFDPSGPNSLGKGGFRKEFSNALKHDPLLKYKYLYAPIKEFSKRRFKSQPEEIT